MCRVCVCVREREREWACARVHVFTCLSDTHMGERLVLIGVYYIFFVLLMLLASGGAIYIQIQNLRNTGFST